MIRALQKATVAGYTALVGGAGLYVAAAASNEATTTTWAGRLFLAGAAVVICAGIPAHLLDSKGQQR